MSRNRLATSINRSLAKTSSPTLKARGARKASSKAFATLSLFEEKVIRDILATPQDYMDSPEFRKRGATKRIYEDSEEIGRPDVSWYRPLMDDFNSANRRTNTKSRQGSTILLTAAQERVLFLKFNYARFQIARIQEKLNGRLPSDAVKRDLLKWHGLSRRYREQIAETNLALVLAMAKRSRMSDVDFGDLVSEGNMALMRSVDKFDCERGFKFSTYACRAILKAFSRHGMKMSRYRQRFPAEFDPALEKGDHLETVRATHDQECAEELKHIVLNNDAQLSDVELAVISHRFGVGDGTASANEDPRTLTLEQVGQIIGVTKERVRQIQNKALAKIKDAMEDITPRERPTISSN